MNSIGTESIVLLRGILEKQNEQNALLQALVKRQSDPVRQNAQWKHANPELSKRCAGAVKRANDLMTQIVQQIVEGIEDLDEDVDWEENYPVFELINAYGPRLQQFNIILNTLTQLGTE